MGSNLAEFDVEEMLHCSAAIKRMSKVATSMEGAARRICGFLYDELQAPDGGRGCALVRCYKTHRFAGLEPELRDFARAQLPRGTQPDPEMRCLTLLATAGAEPDWNSRHRSRGHRAIPLPSPDIVERAPMIAQLIRQFGLDITQVVRPNDDVMRDRAGKGYNVFYIERALGSPYIPAQREFVQPYGIESVVGFGGSLRAGDLFAFILFARVHIPPRAAERFRALALDAKTVLFGMDDARVFEG